MQDSAQAFISQAVAMALPIFMIIALLASIYLKRSLLSVARLFIYLGLTWFISDRFYYDTESWTSEPTVYQALLYGSAMAAGLFGMAWFAFHMVWSMDNTEKSSAKDSKVS